MSGAILPARRRRRHAAASRRVRRFAIAGCVVATLIAASGCSDSSTDAIPSSAPPPVSSPTETPTPETVAASWRVDGAPATLASGLAAPWSVVPLDGGGALLSERDSGVIRHLASDGNVREVGVVPGVVSGGESGLHGLAVLDDGDERWMYAYHGAADDNRVVRMALDGDDGALTLGETDVVFAGIPRNSTHNGGRIAFGPDGMLYVTTGDAQDRDAAQDPAALGGKILRLTPDGAPAPGNPFDSAVWSYGHRNVQGIAWTADGTMWASEFGQNAWDELNRIEPGGNYGWPVVEGDSDDPDFVAPAVTWTTAEASPSGIAAVGETVFVAGLRGARLWRYDASTGELDVALDGQGRLRDAAVGPDCALWVLTNNTDGRGSPRDGDDVLLRVPLAPA